MMEYRLWNDLLCVEWDVKPYTLTHLQCTNIIDKYAYGKGCTIYTKICSSWNPFRNNQITIVGAYMKNEHQSLKLQQKDRQ